jgi:anthranilate phosphoribosyltransferase
LKNMGLKGAMVVHSGLDEVSIAGPTRYARLSDGRITKGEITPEQAGLTPMSMEDLKVASPMESAQKIKDLFDGKLEGACLNSLLLNAAAAFMAVDGTVGIRDGVVMAAKVIRNGEALNALKRART